MVAGGFTRRPPRRAIRPAGLERSFWMAKTKRGKPLRKAEGARQRGRCPLCSRTGVKLLYELKADGKAKKVCKQCKNAKLPEAPAAEAPAEAAKE